MITKTSLALRNGLTVPNSYTAIERVTLDLRRDVMRVSFTTKVDDEDGAVVESRQVRVEGIPPGIFTAIESVAAVAAKAICDVPLEAATRGSSPSSRRRSMFSSTTIASSITTPTASARACGGCPPSPCTTC